jgi:hypothetical protein
MAVRHRPEYQSGWADFSLGLPLDGTFRLIVVARVLAMSLGAQVFGIETDAVGSLDIEAILSRP